MQSGAKNPPWARGPSGHNAGGMNHQYMDPNAMAISQQNIMPFQQSAMYNPIQQGSMGILGGQVAVNQINPYGQGVVAYPTPRSNAFQGSSGGSMNNSGSNSDKRVFTGTVTKAMNDFGFVDEDVFYQTSVVAKGQIPQIGDRVLVEAVYNATMPFKWNATRVQILPAKIQSKPQSMRNSSPVGNYTNVPPPLMEDSFRYRKGARRDDRPSRDERPESISDRRKRSRSRSKSPARKLRKRDSSERKRKSVSPPPPKYLVRVPKVSLDLKEADITTLSSRYPSLYIPSDFFHAKITWGEALTPDCPFPLNNPCAFHIMPKDAVNPTPNDAVLEPADVDYSFSAKVMLISLLPIDQVYQKSGIIKSKERREDKTPLSRVIKFLVGHKGKGTDNFAIGGPWSPSLDGANPDKDPAVLIKTAMRNVKALTGIDLSACTQWYRVVEFNYWRTDKERLERVVLFTVDVWSALAPQEIWDNIKIDYERAYKQQQAKPAAITEEATQAVSLQEGAVSKESKDGKEPTDKPQATPANQIDFKTIKVDALRKELEARGATSKGLRPQLMSRLKKLLKTEEKQSGETSGVEHDETIDVTLEDEDAAVEILDEEKMDVVVIDDADDAENSTNNDDLKVIAREKMKVDELKKVEEKKKEGEDKKKESDDKKKDAGDKKGDTGDKKGDVDEKKGGSSDRREGTRSRSEKDRERDAEKAKLRWELPSTPHIVIHPNATAKGGKFGCSVVTLSLLLDYRIADNKEHNFELFVFAELFNEMLQRDFGFYIYKTLNALPDVEQKSSNDKESDTKGNDAIATTSESKEEKKDNKEENKEEKKDDKDKKEDKKDDKDRKEEDKNGHKSRKDDRDRRDRDRRRSLSPKLALPKDPHLLLSIFCFDTSHCGYMSKKDLQQLLLALGLKLSRSQLNSVINKATMGTGNFSYRHLLDKSIPAIINIADTEGVPETTSEELDKKSQFEAKLARGNLDILRSDSVLENGATTKEVPSNGIVTYKSRIVDIPATLTALSRSEARCAVTSASLNEARAALRSAKKEVNNVQDILRIKENILTQLRKDNLHANTRVKTLLASSKIFHTALKDIQSKVDAVINIDYEEKEIKSIETLKVETKDVKKVELKEKDIKEEKEDKKEDKSVTHEMKADNETIVGGGNTGDNVEADTKDMMDVEEK